jgi:poly(3-hydroxybutyrate) depolymerase
MDVSGTQRTYTLKIPDNYDQNNPYRLIFGFHWLGGSMTDVVSLAYYGLDQLSEGSAIFVAPDGLSSNGSKGWPNRNGQDIEFTKQMVTLFEANLCVDQARIFSTGFSYGGIMSFNIASQMSDVFRAIAPAERRGGE